jgi:hypothetical protein
LSVSDDQCARFQLPPSALIEGRMSEIVASGPEVDCRNATGSAGLVSTPIDRAIRRRMLSILAGSRLCVRCGHLLWERAVPEPRRLIGYLSRVQLVHGWWQPHGPRRHHRAMHGATRRDLALPLGSIRHPSSNGVHLCRISDASRRVGRQRHAHARFDPFGRLGAQGGERHLRTAGAAGHGPE